MPLSGVSIYCLANIRAPWVLVFEPHPWGHGALRVKEESAVLVYWRPATDAEQRYMAGAPRHECLTFEAEAALLDYEDGQHERAAEVAEAIGTYRRRVDAVLAQVERKRADKKREERARTRLALPQLEE